MPLKSESNNSDHSCRTQQCFNTDITLKNSCTQIENDLEYCGKHSLTERLVHLLHLQLSGLCDVESEDPSNSKGEAMYGEIHLNFKDSCLGGVFAVPRKIPTMPIDQSPYVFRDDCVYFNGKMIFNNETVSRVPLPERNKPRYLKGYSFPFLGTSNPYYELRINPKNTGKCPGRCSFCHRAFAFRFKPTQEQKIKPPDQIVQTILREFGLDVVRQVTHVSVITELFGSERTFLDYLKKLKHSLIRAGCAPSFSFRACSQDVRSESGLRELISLVDSNRYSYTLEVFSDRQKILGKYKGLSLDRVESILATAKAVGFKEIKLNYVVGIDSLQSFRDGIKRFDKAGLVDCLGASILTSFFPEQHSLRHPSAWSIFYYLDFLKIINQLGISMYEPTCFEMGFPVQFLQPELPWMQIKKSYPRH